MSKKIRVLICRVLSAPVVEEIGTDLETFQALVGGYVECVPLDCGLTLWCNEEAIGLDLPPNRGVRDRAPVPPPDVVVIVTHPDAAPPGEMGVHHVRGDFFIAGDVDDEGDTVGLTDAEVEVAKSVLVEYQKH